MNAGGLTLRLAPHLAGAVLLPFALLSSCSLDRRQLELAMGSTGGEPQEPGTGGAPSESQGGADAGVGAVTADGGAASLSPVCGNGVIEPGEACDDGGEAEHDGCNVACELEPGYDCSGEPSACRSCEGDEGARRCAVAGGAFERGPDGERAFAAVSTFRLDELEATVGRFRLFVAEFEGAPAAGAGAHSDLPNSGWQQAWGASLPGDRSELVETLHCGAQWETWTDEPGEREDFPINCLSYYVAFAYCVAQGGRLPTEAEWEYAAAGGAQERPYPWGDTTPSIDLALFDSSSMEPVGVRVAGRARFGQLDLAGSVWEWSLDLLTPYPASCDRCAQLENGFERVLRGGSFLGSAELLRASYRFSSDPSRSLGNVGVRCAYGP
jgi:formylglycine-generating enzyme